MLGLGLGINKSIPKKSIFNLPNALHEWYRPNATDVGTTVTEVDTGSIAGFNTANPNAASEPTLNADNIQYNGTTQYTLNNTSNFRSADTTGVMHFKIIPTDNTPSQANYIWGSSSNSVLNLVAFMYVNLKPRILIRTTANILALDMTNAMTLNVENTFTFYSNGSTIKGILNGGVEVLTIAAGISNDGRWFNFATGRNNVSSGGLIASSGNFLGKSKQKYKNYTPLVSDAATLTDHNLIRTTNF